MRQTVQLDVVLKHSEARSAGKMSASVSANTEENLCIHGSKGVVALNTTFQQTAELSCVINVTVSFQ